MFEDLYADGSTDGAAYPALDGEDDWSYPDYPEEDGEGDDPSGDGAELVACTADAPLKDVELDVFTAFMTTEVGPEHESPGGVTSQGSPWDVLDYPEGGDTQFNFGVRRGSTYLEVLRQHPDYYHWGLQEKKPSPQLTAYLTWVYRHFVVPRPGQSTLRGHPEQEAEVKAQHAQEARRAVCWRLSRSRNLKGR